MSNLQQNQMKLNEQNEVEQIKREINLLQDKLKESKKNKFYSKMDNSESQKDKMDQSESQKRIIKYKIYFEIK